MLLMRMRPPTLEAAHADLGLPPARAGSEHEELVKRIVRALQ